MSMRNTLSPSVFFFTWSTEVVRARRSIRSDWSTREMNIFWPLTTCLSPLRRAVVWSLVVSEPALGSVTPKAWRRSSPVAIFGRYVFFCASEPCRSTVPMMYIWAWQAPALPPEGLIAPSVRAPSRPPSARAPPARPAVLPGDQRREVAGLGELVDEALGVLALGVEVAPVLGGVLLAEIGHRGLQRPLLVGEYERHVLGHGCLRRSVLRSGPR